MHTSVAKSILAALAVATLLGGCSGGGDAGGGTLPDHRASAEPMEAARQTATVPPCPAGPPTVLVAGQQGPATITADETYVYWGTLHDGGVWRAPLAGGAALRLAKVPGASPAQLAVDDANIYWADASYSGAVRQTALDGSSTIILAANQDYPSGVAVVGGRVFWTNSAQDQLTYQGTVNSAPVGGGPITVHVTAQKFPLYLSTVGPLLYWTNTGDAGAGNGSVAVLDLITGRHRELVTSLSSPAYLSASVNGLVWNTEPTGFATTGSIQTAPLLGGAPSTVASATLPLGIAVAAGSVYWATGYAHPDGTGGSINVTPLGSGSTTQIAADDGEPVDVVVRRACAYWTDYASGLIKVARVDPQ